ncbi:MAG TPA: hypothetical protein VKR32_06295 [Puia sp.]|nr:hypothetical protein [Puia sp.]
MNINRPDDITYWTKRWEISAHQLLAAMIGTKSTSVSMIADYLEKYGFHGLPTVRS